MIALIQYNLDSVRKASEVERATIVAARAAGDEITANIMIPLLQGSEDGIALYEELFKANRTNGPRQLLNFTSIMFKSRAEQLLEEIQTNIVCPPATQDISLNLANRKICVDKANYGPANPELENPEFWQKKLIYLKHP
jgi:hypothetical protein